ncbi:hypothetical protein GE061_013820 [Apolygus lucorum]|uniref:Uncharacterized protein n=1 Tax=Apolygus lucorum TaxID=248454 RepID=A0A6A4JMF4_APOLU|nr:hypothetical protein GE061_013820 [Apolygus lucorum]
MKSQCGVSKRRDVEKEELQVYLTRLKDLVPFMPKNRKLSKLEVIQYVIDYICDLQEALEAPGSLLKTPTAPNPRQPLGVLASNTNPLFIEETNIPLAEKPSPSDTRPVSV